MNKRIVKLALTGLFGWLATLLGIYLYSEGYINVVVAVLWIQLSVGGSIKAMGKM